MKTDNISMIKVNGYDCFYLKYLRASTTPLHFYLEQFNIEDYWIYKCSNKQKLVSIEEFMKFEYAGYIFYKKELYKTEHIDLWINTITRLIHSYLSKPTPPFSPNKIIIKK
jgi:hypothetical protein